MSVTEASKDMHFSEYEQAAGELQAALSEAQAIGGESDSPDYETQLARVELMYRNYEREFQNCVEAIDVNDDHRLQVLKKEREDFTDQVAAMGASVMVTEPVQPVEQKAVDRLQRETERVRLLMREKQMILEHQIQKERFELEMRQRRDKLNLEVERAMLEVKSAEDRISKKPAGGDDVLNAPCETSVLTPNIGISDGGGEGRDRRFADSFIHSSVTGGTSETNETGEGITQVSRNPSQVVSSVPGFSTLFSAHERVMNPNNSHVVVASPSGTSPDAPNSNNNHVVGAQSETPSSAPDISNNHVLFTPHNETSARATEINNVHMGLREKHGVSPPAQNINKGHVFPIANETFSRAPEINNGHVDFLASTQTPLCTSNVNNSNTRDKHEYLFDTVDLVNALQAPPAQLQSFDGNPLKFHSFMLDFEANVERRLRDPAARMSRLRQQCIGRAAAVIQSCASLPPNEGYDTAKELLKQRFGTPILIAQATIESVMKQERVKKDDAKGLQQFADQLRVSYITLEAVNGLAEINSQQGLMTIVQKLPEYLQHKWRSQAVKINSDEGRLCTFLDLTKFIERAALESNLPVFGVKPTERFASRHDSNEKKHYGNRASVNNVTNSKKAPMCVICKGDHWISRCEKFRNKSAEERNILVKDKRLCFNCLSDKHLFRQCKSNLKCRECNRSHHTLLHRKRAENSQKENEQVVTVNKEEEPAKREVTGCVMQGSSQRVSLPVCAIKVRPLNGGKEISTFCLLDQGSSCSFVSQQLVKQLGMKPKKSTMTISTVNCSEEDRKTEVVSFIVSDIYGNADHTVSRAYTLPTLPVEPDDFPRREDISCYPHLAGIDLPDVELDEVTVLLGQTDADCLIPLDVVQGQKGDPYATRTKLGWTINGPMKMNAERKPKVKNFHAKVRDCCEELREEVKEFWKLESHGLYEDTRMLSEVDKRVLKEWEETTTFDGQNFNMIIPFKSEKPQLPNSKPMAVTRVRYLEKRLKKDKKLCEQYTERMENMITKGYAERVPEDELCKDNGKVFYVPHHGIMSPNKDKIRVVFDCAAKYKGQSLNQFIHAGPDQTQKLVGVLLRFRVGKVAVMADIQEMYYQVKVQPQDRDVLRFLWFTGGRLDDEPEVYRMTRHLFGGTWSPSCCLTALQYAVRKFGNMKEDEQEAVIRSFYVDDYLRSSDTVSEALQHAVHLKTMLAQAGFNITKWLSNELAAVSDIPESQQSAKTQDLALGGQVKERALGVMWHVDSDNIGYNVCDKSKPITKRGVLSTLSSVYNPLGLVSPFILQARVIMQELCRQKIEWDDQLPELQAQQWDIWKKDLKKLSEFKVPRWIKTRASTSSYQLHHFCDASMVAYGVVSYLVMKGEEGQVQSEIVMAKSRLAPIKVVSIPRLELLACTLAARQDRMLTQELSTQVKLQPAQFWTDSKIVLGYINNTEKRFHTFVANRVEVIKDHTQAHQWHHVESAQNPADDASRGVSPEQLMTSRWLHGPQFLIENVSMVWSQTEHYDLIPEDPEVKSKDKCLVVVTTKSPTERFIEYHSGWENLLVATAWILATKDKLVRSGEILPNINSERLRKLNPILCDGIMLLGGRLASAPVGESIRHPVILPSDYHVTELLVSHVLKGTEGDKRSARIRTKTGDVVRPIVKLRLLEPD